MVRTPTKSLFCSCWKPVTSQSDRRSTSPSPSSAHYETADGSIGPGVGAGGQRVGTSTKRESAKEGLQARYLGRLWGLLGGSKKQKQYGAETAATPDGYAAPDVYDYIDGDCGENATATRGEGGTRGVRIRASADARYEYPVFNAVAGTSRPAANNPGVPGDEPLYTSASQIYSQAGSEDPYSSIISDSRRNLAAVSTALRHQVQPSPAGNYSASSSLYADGGYARVKEEPFSSPRRADAAVMGAAGPRRGRLDQLYAQINHQTRRTPQQPITAEKYQQAMHVAQNKPAQGCSEIRSPRVRPPAIPPRLLPPPTTTIASATPLDRGVFDVGQAAESGSGSILSRVSNGSGGSSRNPSYRYLTVRESVDVVRERIRRRDEEHRRLLPASQSGPPLPNGSVSSARAEPHYYSTIANEYESLGGGSVSGGYSLLYESLRQPAPAETAVASSVEITGGVVSNDERHHVVEAPAPPTSPIPNRLEPMPMQMSGGGGQLGRLSTPPEGTEKTTTSLIRRPIVISPLNSQRISDPGALWESRWRLQPAIPPSIPGINTAQPSAGTEQHQCDSHISPSVSDNPAGLVNIVSGRSPLPIDCSATMTTSWTSTTDEGVSGSQAETETQTPPPSRIPRPRLLLTRSRSTSPSTISVTSGGFSSRTRPNSQHFAATTATQTTAPIFNSSSFDSAAGSGSGRNAAVNTGNFRLRRLEPPPSPHGNDYISRVDLGEERSWPLDGRG